VFRRVLDARNDSYDPWLYEYCGGLQSSAETARYRRHLDDILECGRIDPHGLTALDAGCGFGFTLLLLRSLGASHTYGIDSSAAMIATIRAYLPVVPHDLSSRIHVTEGSVTAMPYGDGSFDLVLSVEAISHYRDVSAFIAEAARVTRPGGTLLVRDGNNGRNPKVRRETRALWEEFETGKPSRLVGTHGPDDCYRARRGQIILEAFPDMSDDVVEDLALRTSSMSRDEILTVVRAYEAGGSPPASFFDGTDAPLDPNSDAVVERLFDPYELAAEIAATGFSTRVSGYWGGAGGNPLVRLANRALGAASRITIASAPSFTIAARRL
jgi:SAM-dependent methyltransferase